MMEELLAPKSPAPATISSLLFIITHCSVTPFRVSLLVTFICLTLIDLETTSKQTSGGAGTSHYPASTGKLGPFLHDNGQQQRTMVHVKSRAKHQGL